MRKSIALILVLVLLVATTVFAATTYKGKVVKVKGNKVTVQVENKVTKLKKGDTVTITEEAGEEEKPEEVPMEGC
jgi:anionic cell wall polymer biosynthesis LytR-Cps2A-Psr (LCP) family protein